VLGEISAGLPKERRRKSAPCTRPSLAFDFAFDSELCSFDSDLGSQDADVDQLPPEVELKPLPLLDWTPLEDWKPLLDELLLDPFDELPEELEPEFDVAPVDEPEPDEDLLPVLVVAA
jgi:hypothetical protein